MRRTRLYLLLLLPCLILTGCYDRLELEEQAYIITIGVDKGNMDHSISVTYQIANPQVGPGGTVGKSETEPVVEVITLQVPDIVSGREMLSATVTRRPTFTHASTLIVGEEMVKSDKFMTVLEASIRDRQMRRETFLIVTEGKAEDFIRNNKPKMETRLHKYYQFMQERWGDTGLVPISSIHQFIQRTEGDAGLYLAIYGAVRKQDEMENGGQKKRSQSSGQESEGYSNESDSDSFNLNQSSKKQGTKPPVSGYEDQYLAGEMPRKGGSPVELLGSSVLKEGKMIGTMTGEETRMAHLMRSSFMISSMLTTYQDPIKGDYRVSTRLMKLKKSKVELDLEGDRPVIKTTIPLLIDILAIPSTVNYVTDLQRQRLLKDSIEGQMEDKAMRLVEKCQHEFKGDPFLWFLEARKKFRTYKDYEDYEWMKKFPDAEVDVEFEVRLRGFEKQLSPPDIEKIRD